MWRRPRNKVTQGGCFGSGREPTVLRYLSEEVLEGLGVEQLYEDENGKAFHAFPERWYDLIPRGEVVDDIDSEMTVFESKIFRIGVEPHPNADRLELARVGDFRCVIGKGNFADGDFAAYIPEAAIVPDDVIAEMGLEGRLAGKKNNRVKAVKLRGVLSQGLVYPIDGQRILDNPECLPLVEGDDVTDVLGLVKYEPPIPVHMSGQVENYVGKTLKYDIENIKKYPDIFEEGEPVVFTEKLHGTWCAISRHDEDGLRVTSKGLSARGLVFKMNVENKKNLYVHMLYMALDCGDLVDLMEDIRQKYHPVDGRVTIVGEVFGLGVQDLHYGTTGPEFRVCDIWVAGRDDSHPRYLDTKSVLKHLERVGMEYVPVLYEGPFSKEALEEHTSGDTALGGGNIRKGIVIRPKRERRHDEIGRVILKSVSDAYLLRKGSTEPA